MAGGQGKGSVGQTRYQEGLVLVGSKFQFSKKCIVSTSVWHDMAICWGFKTFWNKILFSTLPFSLTSYGHLQSCGETRP